MVTHDMGSVIKYCDRVVLLNKGHYVAEGPAGKMVDLYKKILANQMDALEEELAEMNDFSGGMDGQEVLSGDKKPGLMKDKISINPNRTEYGNGKAEIYDLGLFDERGNLTNLLLKGEYFEIKERIRFFDTIQAPIFTYTIKDKKGV